MFRIRYNKTRDPQVLRGGGKGWDFPSPASLASYPLVNTKPFKKILPCSVLTDKGFFSFMFRRRKIAWSYLVSGFQKAKLV